MSRRAVLHCLITLLILIPAPSLFAEEVLTETRFMGNFTISDETMLQLADVRPGSPADDSAIDKIRQRLLDAGLFERVETAKRYRSFGVTDEIVLIITVKEKEPIKSKFMYGPILSGSDDYGITYGLRGTAKNLLGLNESISLPLSWGGNRRAALEGKFDLHNPIAQNLIVSAGVSRKENPYYRIGDFRKEAGVTVKRGFKLFEINAHAGWTDVDFGSNGGNFAAVGANLVFDARQDVNLPRNAIYMDVGWKRLLFTGGKQDVNVRTVDLRGYKGIFGQAVLAGQFYYSGVNGPLPDYERPFIGGSSTLRGHRPGAFIGDNITTASLELRLPLNPLTSPAVRYGVNLFFDSGAVYDYGESIGNAKFRHGTGIGAFFLIMGFGIKADVAYNTRDAFRVHYSTGFRF